MNLQSGKTQHEKLLARGNFNPNDRAEIMSFFSLKKDINILNTKNTEIECIYSISVLHRNLNFCLKISHSSSHQFHVVMNMIILESYFH